MRHSTTICDWKDRDVVEREHLPEIEQLVEDHVEGADRVHLFDQRI